MLKIKHCIESTDWLAMVQRVAYNFFFELNQELTKL